MKIKHFFAALLFVSLISARFLFAGNPEQEKAFVEKYKTAFEAGDKATLESFLYTKDAHPMALEFYKMMQQDGAGKKISSIELVDLTPAEVKKAAETQDGPGGLKMKMPLKPTKKLKISIENKDETGSSTSSSESFIAEKDGKYLIPVPVAAK